MTSDIGFIDDVYYTGANWSLSVVGKYSKYNMVKIQWNLKRVKQVEECNMEVYYMKEA